MNRLLALMLSIVVSVHVLNSHHVDGVTVGAYNYYADQLEAINVFTDTTYAYELEGKPTRLEVALLIYDLLGVEEEASYGHVFNDIPKSADEAIGYLYSNRYITGISHNLYGSKENISASGFATLLLRLLGYQDTLGDFDYGEALSLVMDKGVINEEQYGYLSTGVFKRKHMVEMLYLSLSATMKFSNKTLAEYLVLRGGLDEALVRSIGKLPEEYRALSQSVTTYRTSHNTEDYIQIDIDEEGFHISGYSASQDNQWLWARLEKGSEESYEDLGKVSKGNFHLTIQETIPEGQYKLGIYSNKEQYGTYQSWVYDLDITNSEDGLRVPLSAVYPDNYQVYYFQKGALNMEDLLKSSTDVQVDDPKIQKLATDITQGLATDYDKAMAIHDWVAEHIYYDKDAYYKGEYGTLDALGVLETKKSVCQGYATLTAALMRASHIPCAVVAGYALGINSTGGFLENKDAEANHAWNECFIDGRWVIMDVTWDSRNEFINNQFVYGGMTSREYFDTTLEHFSVKHKIMEYCWYY